MRQYDEGIGRFVAIDPLWEDYRAHTPYNYCGNNPVLLSDPDGKAWPIIGAALLMLFTESQVANAPRNISDQKFGLEKGRSEIARIQVFAAVSTGVVSAAKYGLQTGIRAFASSGAGVAKEAAKDTGKELLGKILAGDKRSTAEQAKSFGKAIERYTEVFKKEGAEKLQSLIGTHEKAIAKHLEKIADPNNPLKSSMKSTVRNASQQINAIKEVLTKNGGVQ